MRPLLIGLSGPIGCGKSTVAGMLAQRGGVTIDADQLARQATMPGSAALREIGARFGGAVFTADGQLDRAEMARLAFEDQAALADLEEIVHPYVRQLVDRQLADAAADQASFVVVEAIKLIEGGLAERCDEVWIVDCAPATQRARLTARGATAADIERRMAAQGQHLAERLIARLGDRRGIRRIPTDGSLDETGTAVENALAAALASRGT